MSTNLAKVVRDRFSLHDHHTHSFSHCVSRHNNEPYWENLRYNNPQKLYHHKMEYIRTRLRAIFGLQSGANVEWLSITEHPCWDYYDVPFEEYVSIFEAEKAASAGSFRQLNMGVEANIINDPTENKVYIDFRDFRDPETRQKIGVVRPSRDDEERLKARIQHLNPIIASVHHKHYFYKENPIKNTEDYLALLVKGIQALRELLDDQNAAGNGKKVGILGHPWSLPGYFNYLDCPVGFGKETQRERSQDRFMASKEAPFPYFSETQLDELCAALVRFRIFPEINHFYIKRGWSDLRKRPPFPKRTIMEHYIQFCKKNRKHGIRPVISVGTDMHNIKFIGQTEYETVAHQVPSIGDALVWATVEDLP